MKNYKFLLIAQQFSKLKFNHSFSLKLFKICSSAFKNSFLTKKYIGCTKWTKALYFI